MAKKLHKNETHIVSPTPPIKTLPSLSSTRLPLWTKSHPSPPEFLPVEGMDEEAQGNPLPGYFYRAQLTGITVQGDHYVWHWTICKDASGMNTPRWRLVSVTDAFYAPGTTLKQHLDTLIGRAVDIDAWKMVGLGRLIGRMYVLDISSGYYPIVPHTGDHWKDGPEVIITHAKGIRVDSVVCVDRDASLFASWVKEVAPRSNWYPALDLRKVISVV